MRVKVATFQKMGSVERVQLEYVYSKYIKKSQRLAVRAMTDLFLVTLQIAVP
jgi:hypothetical protein